MAPLSITLHGVFMEIAGQGVLLSGASGSGKSELALELITRGHRLIADDAPEFILDSAHKLTGSCPAMLQDFLEIHALGVVNIRALFGNEAVCPRAPLDLIVRLEKNASPELRGINNPEIQMCIVLNLTVPELVLPLQLGRNHAVLLECLVRNHQLQRQGYRASQDFSLRQQQALTQ